MYYATSTSSSTYGWIKLELLDATLIYEFPKKMSQALPGIGKEIFQRKEMNNKKINWDKKDFNQGYNFLWPAISGCL